MSVITDLIDENSALHRRVAELEADRDSHQRCAIKAISELAALKAQDRAESDYYRSMLRAVLKDIRDEIPRGGLPQSWNDIADSISASLHRPLYAAPVSEAKAQGVVIPSKMIPDGSASAMREDYFYDEGWNDCIDEVARLNAAPVQQVSVPDGATLILGDTGRKDLDRLIDRLMSSDPDFEDCTAAAALLRRLFMEEISGPKGHATWKDAAVAERLRRVSMRPSETVVAMAREGLAVYSGPNMNEHKVCAEIVRLADISDTAMLAAAPAAPAADAG